MRGKRKILNEGRKRETGIPEETLPMTAIYIISQKQRCTGLPFFLCHMVELVDVHLM